ncbi:PepSY-associated TM helix domain-containing protein [Flavobacterium sp. '19STA2R22 D10 B1']|uniref:PepSY-associated TM helix domain-containing protein n=1 Tax=Flavobacterium aerium TaxID=3037261 RepID=UPI00278C1541|nr:PepSY-associated TM helix domain-containing protein [Flavobacterium sp. '19STA2R22 D10 B1']
MTFKNTVKIIHRWLGLTSGLIVFIVSITGCIFCFHDEIKDLTRDWRKVETQEKAYVLPTVLQEKAINLVPNSTVSMVAYAGRDRSAYAYSTNKDGSYFVYFNPYSGEYLHTEKLEDDFFIIVEYIHLYLLLPAEIGKHIVAISTLIFIAMMIMGILLWWPKRKSDRKRSFKIKWNAKWRRVNYDLHNVFGFYIAAVATIIAITGLTFSYEWVSDTLYYTANLGGDRAKESQAPIIDTTKFNQVSMHAMNKAMTETFKIEPDANMFFVMVPTAKNQSILTGAYPHSLRFDHQSNYHFHPYDASLLKKEQYAQKSAGMKLIEMNYGIHTGQILNLPGKIIAFFTSLLAASLPITGFIMWWGRKNKKSKKKS